MPGFIKSVEEVKEHMKFAPIAFLLTKAIVSHMVPILNIADRRADYLKMEVAELKVQMMKIYENKNKVIYDEKEFRNSMIDKFNPILLSLQDVLNRYSILSKENEANSNKVVVASESSG